MRACIIWNPKAGQGLGSRRTLLAVSRQLESAGWKLQIWESREAGHATSLARQAVEAGYQVVVAAGGDGTVNEVLNGLVGTGAILGVIPLGTTNVWAREMGIPLNPTQAAALLLDGEVRTVDVGMAGDRYFLLMAGVGFDGEVMRAVEPEAKRRFGILAYLLVGAWAALTFRGTRADIVVDDRRLRRRRIQLMVLGNTRRYAFVEITPQARADDGLLDVCIFEGKEGFLTKIRHLIAVLLGRHIRSPEVEYLRGAQVVVWTQDPLPVQADGEYIGSTPMTFRVIPRAIRVILARELPKGLLGESGVVTLDNRS